MECVKKPLVLNDNIIEQVTSFTYLGSVVNKEGGSLEDVKSQIKKANGAFVQLYPIWNNMNLSRRTKIQLLNTNLKSVLLYGSKTWKVIDTSPDHCKPWLTNVYDKYSKFGGLIKYLTRTFI